MNKYKISLNPTIGLCVSTYAHPWFVKLNLAAARIFSPGIPVLVYDDCSQDPMLKEICAEYGAEFISSPIRLGHQRGDANVYPTALNWANNKNIELLIKISSRCVPLYNWVPEFVGLAIVSQYATYSSDTNEPPDGGFGFRTNICAFHVPTWNDFAMDEMKKAVADNIFETVYVENFIHNIARRIQKERIIPENQEYDERNKRHPDRDSYGNWLLAQGPYTTKTFKRLSHWENTPEDFLEKAIQFGIKDAKVEYFK